MGVKNVVESSTVSRFWSFISAKNMIQRPTHQSHLSKYQEKQPIRCKVCGFVTLSRSAMRRHCNVNHVKKNCHFVMSAAKIHSDADLTKHMICSHQRKKSLLHRMWRKGLFTRALKRHHLQGSRYGGGKDSGKEQIPV